MTLGMDELPWHLLFSGAALLGAGAGLRFSRTWLDRLCATQGGREASGRERRILPLLVLAGGGGLLFAFLTELVAHLSGGRPYWMTVTTLVWFPLAAASVIAAVLWVVLFRRFT